MANSLFLYSSIRSENWPSSLLQIALNHLFSLMAKFRQGFRLCIFSS